MGKKKNKNRGYLDDDSPLFVPAADSSNADETTATSTTAPATVAAPEVDMVAIRAVMKTILKNYPDKADDWYARTIEKNLKLRKKHLAPLSKELSVMRNELDEELDKEWEEGEEEEERDNEEQKKKEAEEAKEAAAARARAEARVMGRAIQNKKEKKDDVVSPDATNDDDGAETTTKSSSYDAATAEDIGDKELSGFFPNLLLSLRPYKTTTAVSPAYDHPPSALSFLWKLLWSLLSLLAGTETLRLVDAIYDRDAPKRAAAAEEAEAEKAKLEAEEDDTKRPDHLWCPNSQQWIALNGIFSGSSTSADNDESSPPPANIRWERGRWERWAKNLKTRTKKGGPRGTWVVIKVGDGWASAPEKPEVEDDAMADSDVRFFGCIEKGVVIECTDWVCDTLMTKKSARALGVIDCGRAIFNFGGLDEKDIGKGVDGWVLDKYVQYDEDGVPERRTGKKSKKSRAEKRSKRQGYSR